MTTREDWRISVIAEQGVERYAATMRPDGTRILARVEPNPLGQRKPD